jgi:regulatory protein
VTITAIKQQIKRPDRYSVYIDGKYAFPLSAESLLQLRLVQGQELSTGELADLRGDAVTAKAYDQALNLIARRPRSKWEIQLYLHRKKYQPTVIEQVQAKLTTKGYLNDADFARAWIDNRRLLKSTSRRRLTAELRQKHVADEDIQAALDEDLTDERDVLRQLIERKRQQTRYQDPKKLLAYLLRQGYSYEDIRVVLSEPLS